MKLTIILSIIGAALIVASAIPNDALENSIGQEEVQDIPDFQGTRYDSGRPSKPGRHTKVLLPERAM
ncbi:hypothetical protein Cob_v008970 [Colletotrichum orbiculare MAFF 240422]|uniref:Uncharacterized protein n=1 Tax=Colletotrichum orbiculare (strain 104-T / ATCC 96160 / CBS 514.97 / LARS 414 / MAFF 240422) TaxID=1213857 RepID=A0A484FKJ5_COLOR|nr:hypothetical protein Cob_v008970 [Colletotrichum orbiculare MAFF 240422]